MQLTKNKEVKTDSTNLSPTMGYVPSLDGLRAIAIILVLLTHANFQLGGNGILGVDVFFALSGFLITTLLIEENQKQNKISLKAFYIRRTFRLFPALYTMLTFVLIYALIFRNGDDLTFIITEIISSLLYLNNISWSWGWGGEGGMLIHTWTLAVEEQFYLIWPWILILGLSLKSKKTLIIGLTIFITLTISLKISKNLPDLGFSLIHETIFLGCLAAILRQSIGAKIKIPDFVSMALILFIIVIGIMPIKWYMELVYAGGRSIVSFITAIVIISVVDNQSGFTARLLSISPMVWIGKISYSLYIWHVLIFKLFYYHSTLPPSVSFMLKFVVTFIVAGLSWFLIEKKASYFGRAISYKLIDKNTKGTN
jgi:peptidoglycan/LPS O-acetylase OafA/YrhL